MEHNKKSLLDVKPTRLRPRACAAWPPFFRGTRCRRMRPHYRAIDEDGWEFACHMKMFMECLKNTRIAPPTQPPVDSVPIPIGFRDNPPGGTLFRQPYER